MPDLTQLVSVSCNHCGAPLPISEFTRFITCTYCGANLKILHTRDSVRSEVLQGIDQRTQRIEQDVTELKRQSEFEQLDRQWMIHREQLMVGSRNGTRSIPGMAGAFIGMIVAVVFIMFWTAFAVSHNAPMIMPLFGLLGICAAIFNGITRINKAEQYAREEQLYLQQRRTMAAHKSEN